MSTSLATAQHFARCLAEVIGGHPLVDGTPPPPYVNFLKEGTQLFDVCYIDNEDGRLRYVFSSAHDRGGERNQDNAGHTISPPRHKKYTGATNDDDWDDQAFHESHCYRSQTIDERSVSAEASIPLPHGVLPQLLSSMSASFSTSSRDAAGALLYLPRPHTVFKDKRVNLSSSYAKKNTKSWYEHVNKTQRRGVRNGELYFITGCHKTKEWHSLCMYSTQRSRDISINFHPIPEAGITFTGRFFHAAEGMESKKGGVTREDESDTQCVAVRGWKLYLCNRFWRRAKVPVRVNKAGDWKSSDWVPCKSEEPEAPSSGFNAPLLSTSKGLPRPLGLSSRDTDIIDDVESVLLKQRDDEYRVETEKVIAESDDSSWIDSSCNAGSTSVEESHSSHPLTTVFPYLEESAPWMEAAIAHDMQYLALLKKGEYVPETKELVARLFERFVIEVDEDMNGMLVDREQANISSDDLAFVVHQGRHLTEHDIGFDVMRKNIPSGWNLVAPRFGLGLPPRNKSGFPDQYPVPDDSKFAATKDETPDFDPESCSNTDALSKMDPALYRRLQDFFLHAPLLPGLTSEAETLLSACLPTLAGGYTSEEASLDEDDDDMPPLEERDTETYWKRDVDAHSSQMKDEPLLRLAYASLHGSGRDWEGEMGKVANTKHKQKPPNVSETPEASSWKLTPEQQMALKQAFELLEKTDDIAALKDLNQRKQQLQARGYAWL